MELVNSNRRRCIRQKIHSPVFVSSIGDSPEALLDLSEILNISIRGLCFRSQAQFTPGDRIGLRLDFPDSGDSIQTSGRVIWAEPSGRTGIRFRKMPRSSFRLLKQWLFLNFIAAAAQYSLAQARSVMPDAEPESETAGNPAAAPAASGESRESQATTISPSAIRDELDALGADTPAALQKIVDHTRVLAFAGGAALALAAGEDMICRATSGTHAPDMGVPIGLGASFSGECVRRKILLRCDDAEHDPLVDRASCRALGIRSIMAAPLCQDGDVLGLLEVFSPQANAFTAAHEASLREMAEITVASLKSSVQGEAPTPTAPEIYAAQADILPFQPDPLGFAARDAASAEELSTAGPGEEDACDETTRRQKSPVPLRSTTVAFVAAVLALAALLLVPFWRRRNGVKQQPKTRVAAPAGAAAVGSGTPANRLARLREQAENGDAAAQFALGARYATGEDVTQDYRQAAQWFSLAAEQGHVTAQATLGAYYWLGQGVPKDLDKAYFWSILAKAGGDQASKYRIPALASHLSRESIIADQEEANEWIKQHQLGAQDSHPSPDNPSKQ